MAYGVVLYFDLATETLIKGVWAKLAEKGVSDKILKQGSKPHVALSVFDDCDTGELALRLRKLASLQKPVEARFEHLGTYCSKDGVLFLVPVVSPRFFLLHSTVFKILGDCAGGMREGTKPNRFVPHCTVAYGLDKDTLAKTVSLFSNRALPIVGQFEKIALLDMSANMDERCVYSFQPA